MVDLFAPEQRSAVMRAVRSKDTAPEMTVRRAAHRMGYRFRLHRRDLPGCPDLVFPSRRAAIYVHGCFWHGHNCRRGARRPATNTDYWRKKIERNRIRDAANQEALRALGWCVLVVWECETKTGEELRAKLEGFLGERSAAK